MKKLILFFLLALTSQSLYAIPTAKEIVEKADTFRGLGEVPFSFHLSIISSKPDKKQQKNTLKVHVKSGKSLIQFLAPKRIKGRAMLFEGRNLWIHIPKTRRPIRISPAQRLMGESSNGDVAATNFSEDYLATLLGEEVVEKKLCYHLMLKAVDRKITYHKIEYWVDKKTGKPVKSKHFAISGKLLKTAYYKAFINIGKQEKLHRLLLVNPILKGHHTWMIYSRYQKENLADSLFRKENLNRL